MFVDIDSIEVRMVVPLQNYKASKILIVVALVFVLFVHGGILYAITNSYQPQNHMIPLSESTAITMHQMNLSGVDTALDVTNQHDDEENSVDESEEVVEETKESIEKDDLAKEPNEEKPEDKLEEKIEEISETVAEKIITTQQVVPEAPKVQVKKQEVKKTQPKPQSKKQEPKPEAKRQSKRVDNRVLSMQEISVLARPAPNYPRSVMMRRQGGTTILLIKINEHGKAVSVRIEKSSGNDQIDKAAEAAAYKVRLKPYIVDGKAQAIVVRIPYQLKF